MERVNSNVSFAHYGFDFYDILMCVGTAFRFVHTIEKYPIAIAEFKSIKSLMTCNAFNALFADCNIRTHLNAFFHVQFNSL